MYLSYLRWDSSCLLRCSFMNFHSTQNEVKLSWVQRTVVKATTEHWGCDCNLAWNQRHQASTRWCSLCFNSDPYLCVFNHVQQSRCFDGGVTSSILIRSQLFIVLCRGHSCNVFPTTLTHNASLSRQPTIVAHSFSNNVVIPRFINMLWQCFSFSFLFLITETAQNKL